MALSYIKDANGLERALYVGSRIELRVISEDHGFADQTERSLLGKTFVLDYIYTEHRFSMTERRPSSSIVMQKPIVKLVWGRYVDGPSDKRFESLDDHISMGFHEWVIDDISVVHEGT